MQSLLPIFQEFLLVLGRLEKKAEVKRQRLCRLPEFEPMTIFQLLDSDDKKYVDIQDIFIFLQQNELDFSLLPGSPQHQSQERQAVEVLIYSYDQDRDGVLSFEDFLGMVLPRDDPVLRRAVVQRRHSEQHYHQNVEEAMLELLRSEMENVLQIEQMKAQYTQRQILKLFQAIDQEGTMYITDQQLEGFFAEHDHFLYSQEITAILSRIAFHKTNSIEQNSFLQFMTPYVCFTKEEQPIQQPNYPMHSTTKSSRTRPVGEFQLSTQRRVSPIKQTTLKNLSPFKASQQTPFRQSSRKQQQQNRIQQSILEIGEAHINYVLDQLVAIMLQEREVERVKQELALRPDFNLIDFFIMVDQNQKGYLFFQELLDFFDESGIDYLSVGHVQLFYERFSHEDVQLSFSQFASAFTPQHLEYADILNNRKPARQNKPGRFNNFTKGTQNIVQRIIEQYQQNEWEVEQIRKGIDQRNIDLRRIYQVLDTHQNNAIDVGAILEAHSGRKYNEKDLGYLISRFDGATGGTIKEQHFMDTLVGRAS